MPGPERLLYIHGLEATSQGFKSILLRRLYPHLVTPDFTGDLPQRMATLEAVLGSTVGWTIIGSSFGGLMSALFTARHPDQVERQILLAPALIWPDFASNPPDPVDTPTIVFHGRFDDVVPLEPVRQLAQQVFRQLDFRVVEDDHKLHRTAQEIDWSSLFR
jgi:pimeloyl-ACP methyl ester carboxylesterase